MNGSVTICDLDDDSAPLIAAARPSWQQAIPRWLKDIADGSATILVAYCADAPVGVAELRAGQVPEVRNVGVLPTCSRRGIGSALMREVERRTRAERIRVRVGLDNPDARRLYMRLGYHGTGRRVTATYEFIDDAGVRRTATEVDEWMEKELSDTA